MQTTISATLREGVRVLGIYTAGRFDVWYLAGQAKASCRAHVMAALLGLPKVPQSKAGVNAITEEFYRQSGITGDCIASREASFKAFCKSL